MNQVIGDLRPVERRLQTLAGKRVAAEHLEPSDASTRARSRERFLHARWIPPQRADVVAVAEQPGNQQRAGEAARPGYKDAHLGWMMTLPSRPPLAALENDQLVRVGDRAGGGR